MSKPGLQKELMDGITVSRPGRLVPFQPLKLKSLKVGTAVRITVVDGEVNPEPTTVSHMKDEKEEEIVCNRH